MFIVFLRFSENRSAAGRFIDGHREWVQEGLDEGVFLVVGSLKPNLGGGIVAHGTSLGELEARVAADPFVANGVVAAEIFEIEPSKVSEQMEFLL